MAEAATPPFQYQLRGSDRNTTDPAETARHTELRDRQLEDYLQLVKNSIGAGTGAGGGGTPNLVAASVSPDVPGVAGPTGFVAPAMTWGAAYDPDGLVTAAGITWPTDVFMTITALSVWTAGATTTTPGQQVGTIGLGGGILTLFETLPAGLDNTIPQVNGVGFPGSYYESWHGNSIANASTTTTFLPYTDTDFVWVGSTFYILWWPATF